MKVQRICVPLENMKGSATMVLHTREMFGLYTAIVQTIKESLFLGILKGIEH
jgi:hypothetical protein